MAYTCEILRINDLADGMVEVQVRENVDGNVREEGHLFQDRASLYAEVDNINQYFVGTGICIPVILAWVRRRSPDMSNTSLITGKQLVIDPTAAQPIRVT